MLATTILILSADATKPHENSGVNTPFALTKQSVPLSAADEKELAAGKTVLAVEKKLEKVNYCIV